MALEAQARGWRVLRGHLDLDMIGTDALESFAHRLSGEFGSIAVPAQVSQVEVSQVLRYDLFDGLRRVHQGPAEIRAFPCWHKLSQLLQDLVVATGSRFLTVIEGKY